MLIGVNFNAIFIVFITGAEECKVWSDISSNAWLTIGYKNNKLAESESCQKLFLLTSHIHSRAFGKHTLGLPHVRKPQRSGGCLNEGVEAL